MIETVAVLVVVLLLFYFLDKKQDTKLIEEFDKFFEVVPKFQPEDLTHMLEAEDNIGIKKHMNDIFGNGNTLLIEAILHNSNPAVAEIFIKLGANVDGTDKKGRTALYWACVMGYEDKIKLLMKYGANLQKCAFNGDNLLIQICRLCKAPKIVIPLLIEYGIDVNNKGKIGMTALASACAMPNSDEHQIETVKTLLEYGADVNATTDAGVSVLNIAVKNPLICLYVIKLLLENGADMYAVDKNNYNITMNLFACNPNPLPMLELLSEYVTKKFNLNIKDKNGANLLMIAALHNPEPSVLDLLVALNVDPRAKDNNGYSLIDYASQNPNKFMQQKAIQIMSNK